MGIRSLFYATAPRGIVFGSTAPAVAAHPSSSATALEAGIFTTFTRRTYLRRSIYEAEQALRPRLVVDGDGTHDFYWRMDYGLRRYPCGAAEEFRRLLRDASRDLIDDEWARS